MDRYDSVLPELFEMPFPVSDAEEDYEGFCELNEATRRRSWDSHRDAFRAMIARIVERCGPRATLAAIDLNAVRAREVPPTGLGDIVLAVRDRLLVAAARAFAEAHPESQIDPWRLATRAGGKLHDDRYLLT